MVRDEVEIEHVVLCSLQFHVGPAKKRIGLRQRTQLQELSLSPSIALYIALFAMKRLVRQGELKRLMGEEELMRMAGLRHSCFRPARACLRCNDIPLIHLPVPVCVRERVTLLGWPLSLALSLSLSVFLSPSVSVSVHLSLSLSTGPGEEEEEEEGEEEEEEDRGQETVVCGGSAGSEGRGWPAAWRARERACTNALSNFCLSSFAFKSEGTSYQQKK